MYIRLADSSFGVPRQCFPSAYRLSRMCERNTSLPRFLCQSTEGFPHAAMSVRGWFGRIRTFFIPCLAPCIIFMPNCEGFFGLRKRDFQGRENLLLRERQDIHIILLQFVLTVYRLVFRDSFRDKKREKNDFVIAGWSRTLTRNFNFIKINVCVL